jgi:hypothetical protein
MFAYLWRSTPRLWRIDPLRKERIRLDLLSLLSLPDKLNEFLLMLLQVVQGSLRLKISGQPRFRKHFPAYIIGYLPGPQPILHKKLVEFLAMFPKILLRSLRLKISGQPRFRKHFPAYIIGFLHVLPLRGIQALILRADYSFYPGTPALHIESGTTQSPISLSVMLERRNMQTIQLQNPETEISIPISRSTTHPWIFGS